MNKWNTFAKPVVQMVSDYGERNSRPEQRPRSWLRKHKLKISQQPGMGMCNPSTGEAEQVNFKIKARLGYTEN